MRGWHERWPGARRAVRPPHAQIHTHAYLAQRFLLAVELADELHALVLENRERFLVDPQRRAARDPPQLRRPPGFHLHYCRADVFESFESRLCSCFPFLVDKPLNRLCRGEQRGSSGGAFSACRRGVVGARRAARPAAGLAGGCGSSPPRPRAPPARVCASRRQTHTRLKLVEIAGRRGRAGPARARARGARRTARGGGATGADCAP